MASPFLWSPNVVLHEKDRSVNEKLRSIYTVCIVTKDRNPYTSAPTRSVGDAAPILLPLALTLLTERLERLERDRDSLLESYAGLVPEAIDALGSEERHRVYRMISMKAYLTADGSFELSGEVMNSSSLEIASA